MNLRPNLTILLIAGLTFSTLTTCSRSGSNPAPEVSGTSGEMVTPLTEIPLPISAEKKTLSYWFPVDATVLNVISNTNETLTAKVMEEKTNIHIEYIHPAIGHEKELFSVLLSSGDLPDMMHLDEIDYPGGIVSGIADGMLLNINDLVTQYAPNFSRSRQLSREHQKDTVSDDGYILGFPFMSDATTGEPPYQGLYVRQDLLDQLGLKPPKTINDVHQMLLAAKTKLGMSSALLLSSNGVFSNSAFLSAYGVGKGWYQNNGVVLFGPMQEGYKLYLALMNQWYKEGLINPNFVSDAFTGDAPRDRMVSDDVMMSVSNWGRMVDALPYNGYTQNKKFWLTPIPAPVFREGDPIGICVTGYVIGSQTVLTKNCHDPAIAAMWLDYQYSREGMLLNNYGVEDVTYYYDDKGEIQYTDLIMNNPDGLNSTNANRLYLRRRGAGLFQSRREWMTNPVTRYKDIVWPYDVWSKDTTEWMIPQVNMTTDDAFEFQSIMADITTYVEETTVGMIIGSSPITQFDSFVARLKSMGIERAIKIEQAALDRYNRR